MRPQTVIGVLTRFTGGFYYGAVLEGILRAALDLEAIAIAFETERLNLLSSQGDEERILSSSRVSGWLAINEFDDEVLLAKLRERGQPIVHVHSQPKGGLGCAILPDNYSGTRAATEHLINHGHTRIAFAGSIKQVDVAERFAGYQDALAAHALSYDPMLNLSTPSNLESDGRQLAAKVIALRENKDHPTTFTALVAGTDKVALGLMTAIKSRGLRLPRDLAIVGFDDMQGAQFAEPALTTVRQSFAAVAATAVQHLIANIRSGVPLPSLVRVPTQLIVRRSCGCMVSQSMAPHISLGEPDRAAVLTLELLRLAARGNLPAVANDEWPGAAKIATALDAAVRGEFEGIEPLTGDCWAAFLKRNYEAESVVRAMELLEVTMRAWCPKLDHNAEVGGALRDARVALMHAWQRAERVMVNHYESVSEAAYRISAALSGSGMEPSRDLSWIRWSNAFNACCALWIEKAAPTHHDLTRGALMGSGDLQIAGEYTSAQGAFCRQEPRCLSPNEFPAAELLDAAYAQKAMLTVASVPRANGGQYGLLAVVGTLEYEQLDYVGNPGDWAVQLGAALDRARTEHDLRQSAARDALTGLPNRATLLQRLEALRASPNKPSFALLFIDLDDFKKVNDSLGHEAGDQLLVQIATRLTEELGGTLDRRPSEPPTAETIERSHTVARLGGDEFVIVLVGVKTEQEAIQVAGRIQQRLIQPYVLDADTVFISGSIGVNFGHGSDFSAQELLRDADTAMYRAKLQGRARHEVFHHGMHDQALEKLRLDARLRLALERNELELWYQPIVSLATGYEVGAEALIRWRHPEHGLLGPGRFLAVAEDVGLAIPISEWIIKRACAQAVQWQTPGVTMSVNVNVPATHVKQAGFVDFVAQAVAESGLNPGALAIEIVESTLMDEPARCANSLAGVIALGARVAIDDFGTGYSSLSYLRDFPASTLKIDRSFVQNLPHSARDCGIAKAIIAMGQGLGLTVVAEGIETQEQLQFLKQAGCDFAQGFYLSHPLEFTACTERLLRAQTRLQDLGPENTRQRRWSSRSPNSLA